MSKVTVYYENPEADPSEFENVKVEPVGSWLVITDLSKPGLTKHYLPSHVVDAVTEVAPPIEVRPMVISR